MCGILCDFHTVKIGLCRTRPYAKWKSRHLEFICQTAFFDDSGRVTLLVYPIQLCVLVCACMCGMCVVCILYEFVCVLVCAFMSMCSLYVYGFMCVCVCNVHLCVWYVYICHMSLCVSYYVCMGVLWCRCGYVCLCLWSCVCFCVWCVWMCLCMYVCHVNSCVSACLCVCSCVFLQHTKIFPSISQPLDT